MQFYLNKVVTELIAINIKTIENPTNVNRKKKYNSTAKVSMVGCMYKKENQITDVLFQPDREVCLLFFMVFQPSP